MKRDDPKARSLRQERRSADRWGGRVTRASGATWRDKSDVSTPLFLIECKTTIKRQFTLKLGDLINAERHALLDGKTMVFQIEMGGRTWTVMADEDLHALLHPDADAQDSDG